MIKYTIIGIFVCLSLLSKAQQIWPLNIIEITGNEITKTSVIQRELLVYSDSIYDFESVEFQQLLRQSEQRITNLNLFNSVTIEGYIDSTQFYEVCIVLHIHVIEKWYHWPIPFLEFSDRNFNVWGNLSFDPARTNYGLYLFNYNLWGKNHTLKTKLKTGYNKKIGIEYRIPFLSSSTGWGIKASFDYSSQNEVWHTTTNDSLQFYKNGQTNLIKNTTAYIALSKRVSPFARIFFTPHFRNDQLNAALPSSDFLVHNESYQNTYGFQFAIEQDKRNNIFFPTQGSFSRASLTGLVWENIRADYNARLTVKTQKFTQHTPVLYSALSFYSQVNTNKNPPYSQRKILGYDEIIRGFEHYVVDGTAGWKANAAIRFHGVNKHIKLPFVPFKNYQTLPVNIYWELYTDAGYVQYANPDPSNRLVNRFLYAGGIGLNTLFYNDRMVRFEYSLNSLQEHGFFVHFNKAI